MQERYILSTKCVRQSYDAVDYDNDDDLMHILFQHGWTDWLVVNKIEIQFDVIKVVRLKFANQNDWLS